MGKLATAGKGEPLPQPDRRRNSGSLAKLAAMRRASSRVSNRQEECVEMPGKMAKSDPRPPCGLPEVPITVRTLASVLQEGRKSANIHVRSGAIWGNPGST